MLELQRAGGRLEGASVAGVALVARRGEDSGESAAHAGTGRPQLLLTTNTTTNTTTQPCSSRSRLDTDSLVNSSTRACACACRADSVTSFVIPLAMAGTTGVLWARGMLNLYFGTGKLEDQ